ncbi:MAG: glutamate synthase (NADPH), homotetrameric [Parcubacteria group bacterium GW2011_GWA2_38_13b]|nr:MAG: glutamate synthase (NADPH), homotetrameric [Parcubacteria group bacterium GW2011_GWA2_38_13b]
MGKDKKHIEIARQISDVREPEKRIKDFNEVSCGFSQEKAILEASRCLQCKKPKCREGCPAQIDIPSFIKLITKKRFIEAGLKIKESNPLPRVCGRVCPQEIQCEKYCILGIKEQSVAIGAMERYLGDFLNQNDPQGLNVVASLSILPKNGKKVAAVGSGPAGLSLAFELIKLGYDITVFEALHEFGGVLVYGIPEFRLPKEIVKKEIAFLEKLGVKFVKDCVIGKTKSFDDLRREFNAVFLGLGAGTPLFFNISGENLCGVYSANEYLTRVNLMKAYRFPEYDTPILKKDRVVVLGGGNVALDAARTAMRLRASRVAILYRRTIEEMPARTEEVHHAKEEGIIFQFLTSPIRFIGENGWLKRIECRKMEICDVGADGRKRVRPIENSNLFIDCDIAIVAIGATSNKILINEAEGLQINKKGYIETDNDGRTSLEGVYAGGDITSGSATVILALGAGKRAALAIHNHLSNK